MSEPQLTGLAKTFNSVTLTGRANVAKATYSGRPSVGYYISGTIFCAAILLTIVAVKAKNALKG